MGRGDRSKEAEQQTKRRAGSEALLVIRHSFCLSALAFAAYDSACRFNSSGIQRRQRRICAKHRVTFSEAESVFADPLALELSDPDHSESEERWIIVGRSYRERLLVLVFTEWENAVLIISARPATRAEVRSYEEQG